MSETKFTPGPWSVEQPMDFELAIVEAGKPAHEWRFIATCMFPDENGDIPKKEVIANAHLIAAAPDLYAWLERCLAMVDHGAGPPNWDGIRTALAKARGE